MSEPSRPRGGEGCGVRDDALHFIASRPATQRSGCGAERRSSGMSEPSRPRGGERHGACSDVAGMAGLEPADARVKVWCLTALATSQRRRTQRAGTAAIA